MLREEAAHAGLVGNLYTDLLLNDRLQRSGTADIAAVFVALRGSGESELWSLYLRSYEWLWLLAPGTLGAPPPPAIDADAELVARVVRTFRSDWLEGAASFTLLVAPYLPALPKDRAGVGPWMDTAATSIGDRVPDGLTEDDFDPATVPHPAVDGRLTGRVLGDIVDGFAKMRHMMEQCDRIGCDPTQAIAVGDGANDLMMMGAAGLSVAYHAKPKVREQARIAVDAGGLDRLLECFQP